MRLFKFKKNHRFFFTLWCCEEQGNIWWFCVGTLLSWKTAWDCPCRQAMIRTLLYSIHSLWNYNEEVQGYIYIYILELSSACAETVLLFIGHLQYPINKLIVVCKWWIPQPHIETVLLWVQWQDLELLPFDKPRKIFCSGIHKLEWSCYVAFLLSVTLWYYGVSPW